MMFSRAESSVAVAPGSIGCELVHISSGIPNRACFLIAATIGCDKTERIYYRVLAGRYLRT